MKKDKLETFRPQPEISVPVELIEKVQELLTTAKFCGCSKDERLRKLKRDTLKVIDDLLWRIDNEEG